MVEKHLEQVTHVTCIHDVPGFNLDWPTGCYDHFRLFFSVTQHLGIVLGVDYGSFLS